MANTRGVFTGAAIGTLLGSLAIILYPKRREIMNALIEQSGDWADRARDYAGDLINERRGTGNGYATSGLVGALLGAGLALALAPKSGRQFRNQLSNVYRNLFNRSNEVMDLLRNHTHPMRNGVARPHRRKARRLLKTRR